MTDVRHPLSPPPARRGRSGVILAVLLLGLLAGMAATWWAVRTHPAWFGAAAPASQAPAAPVTAPVPLDPGTLATRSTVLAAQLDSLENRTASITTDTQAAAGNAGRAEAILIAFAARRAIERGVGLGYLEPQLRARFGAVAPAETNTVIAAARRPVTLEDLRASLDAAAPTLLASGTGWFAGIGGELRNLIVIHPAGVISPRPADRLSRALRLIDRGNVEAALGEVRRLPGAQPGGAWIDAATRYVGTARALDGLETAAIVGAPAQATAPAAAPTPIPAPVLRPRPAP